jgi:hypothetical protein
MLNKFEEKTEEENLFWAEVYCYMEKNKCDKKTAIDTALFDLWKYDE